MCAVGAGYYLSNMRKKKNNQSHFGSDGDACLNRKCELGSDGITMDTKYDGILNNLDECDSLECCNIIIPEINIKSL